jgi:nucleoside-diphosphate-sugar epimerase
MNVVSASKKKRALVTGALGFTGKYLVEELQAAGYEVFGTAHCDEKQQATPNIFALDLCDRSQIGNLIRDIKPDFVAHLAAVSFVNEGNASRIYETNFLGSYYILEALSQLPANSVQSILLASSANIYGNNPKELLSEDEIPQPVNEYGVSKYAMEKMAQLWMNRLPIFIVRPFNYTGVGQDNKFLIPKIVNHFKEKKPTIELGNLEVWREFNDVRFVVRAYRKLLEESPVGQILNICTGVSYSLNEVIQLCQKITGYPIKVVVNPQFVRQNEVRVLKGDNRRLKHIVKDWQVPSLTDTLQWMLDG